MKALIISPHNDDVLIGCFKVVVERGLGELLKFDDVLVFFDERGFEGNSDRKREAHTFSEDMKLTVVENPFDEVVDVVFAPSPESYHPLHKYWSWRALDLKSNVLVYYSIDMIEWWVRPLSSSDSKLKHLLLDKYFPIESDLWKCDAKYYLFEGYTVLPLWSLEVV